MPLQVSGRPVGMIYTDCSFGVNPLDKATYAKFKSAILLTGKLLACHTRSREEVAS